MSANPPIMLKHPIIKVSFMKVKTAKGKGTNPIRINAIPDRNNKATIKGFKCVGSKTLATIEVYKQSENLFGPIEKEIVTVDVKELKIIQSVWDHFFILKVGEKSTAFATQPEILRAITPKNFKKANIYEVKKLGKPEIVLPNNANVW